jgi:predicted transcriptional regulator of viral defense system
LDADLAALDASFGSRARIHALIARLEKAGRLQPVRRGAYTMVDAGGNTRAGILDLVAALTPKPYAVTAGAALQFHGLTEQHFRLLVVLVNTQLRPWSYRGQAIRYVRTSRKLAGIGTRSRKTTAAIANPARAVADSLDHPAWGVTLPQVAEATDRLLKRDPAFADTLASEIAEHYGHALARRFGFLITALAGADAARPFLLLRGSSKAAAKLLAPGPDRGPVDTTWGVRINVDRSVLTQHRGS